MKGAVCYVHGPFVIDALSRSDPNIDPSELRGEQMLPNGCTVLVLGKTGASWFDKDGEEWCVLDERGGIWYTSDEDIKQCLRRYT